MCNVAHYKRSFMAIQPRIIGVTNSKGGVGKSMLAIQLAYALTKRALSVEFGDLDPNGTASNTWVNIHANHQSAEFPFPVHDFSSHKPSIITQIRQICDRLGPSDIVILDTPADWNSGITLTVLGLCDVLLIPTSYDAADMSVTRESIEKLMVHMEAESMKRGGGAIPVRWCPWKIPSVSSSSKGAAVALEERPDLMPCPSIGVTIYAREAYRKAAQLGCSVLSLARRDQGDAAAEIEAFTTAVVELLPTR
jgi:chromosome partitioning protein